MKNPLLKQLKIKSPIGPIYLLASDEGLTGVHLRPPELSKDRAPASIKADDTTRAAEILKTTERQLTDYFEGKRKDFDLPLALEGTAFQKRVWKELTKIPYGKTNSYKDVAVKLRDKNASRAVGTANSKNPICIIVPCHRVISSDGSLGGYSGGLSIKTKLLKLEGIGPRA